MLVCAQGRGGAEKRGRSEVRLQLDNKTLYGKARNFYLDEQEREREIEKEEERASLDSSPA